MLGGAQTKKGSTIDYLIRGYSLNERKPSQQNKELSQLKEALKILGNVLEYKKLTGDESTGLLKIISDYAYDLDIDFC